MGDEHGGERGVGGECFAGVHAAPWAGSDRWLRQAHVAPDACWLQIRDLRSQVEHLRGAQAVTAQEMEASGIPS